MSFKGDAMNERQIRMMLVEKADIIAKLLAGKSDVEIRNAKNGISVHEVKRSKVG